MNDTPSPHDPGPTFLGLSPSGWRKVGLAVALLAFCYFLLYEIPRLDSTLRGR